VPTNKLWIEHTERAAWDSVAALRTELADAKKRLERLAQLPGAEPPPISPPARPSVPPSDAPQDFDAVARRFVRSMQERHRSVVEDDDARDLEQLLAALEDKVGELGEMDEIHIADAAVEIALLALCLHRQACRGA
jgi:hypothetical protein